MVLEVTARTDRGETVLIGKKEYWEIGLDLDGNHRYGAWQIKEIVDLTLPPRKTVEERFLAELPEGTKSADVDITVTYHPSKKITLDVFKETRTVTF